MGAVRLLTPIPGPRSQGLAARQARAVTAGLAVAHPVFVESASGATLTDVDGNVFIDFTGGIGVMNVGHTHPEVVNAIRIAAGALTHSAFQVAGYEAYISVAETLCRLAPIADECRALLLSTGAEAVENAVKIARAHTGRAGILAFEHAFHGRTLMGMSLTGKTRPYKAGFGPFAPEVYRLPYPYPFRGAGIPGGSIEMALQTIVDPADLAAVIIEPVLGEGGFITPPREFWPQLREFCDRYGVVLILDEVQTGFGRTGTMFACEQLGVAPDLMTVAKSIAAGLPLSAVVGRAAVMDSVGRGGVGGTYGGNPIACHAAIAAMRILETEVVGNGRAALLGRIVSDRLSSLAVRHHLIGEVRGLGAMQAIELVRDRMSLEPAAAETHAVIAAARDRGLLLLSAGTFGNVIRLLMPLTIADGVLDEGLAILEEAMAAVSPPLR
jgi:4-aminobutyrate aminotransferase/(S)-3-amino-2-methylpropionate transaminase